ncbi:MAG: nuclear transport factor 2 family protein [Actinomycetota bacterium]|nr:nuclear transport factor 2 family protein [Actinomycetota bacterium]
MTTSKDVPVETDLAVRRLLARYCLLVDDRDFDQLTELFTEDGRFNALGTDMHGRPAIREWLDTVPDAMFHHVTNVVVSNGSHDTVHALSDCLVGGKRDGAWSIWMLGRYHDTLVGDGRDMHFAQRIFTAR